MVEKFLLYFLLGSIVALLFFAVSRLIDIASSLDAILYWIREFIRSDSRKGGDSDHA